MRMKMVHRAYAGAANVLQEDVEKWEAAGWSVAPKPKKKTTAKETEK